QRIAPAGFGWARTPNLATDGDKLARARLNAFLFIGGLFEEPLPVGFLVDRILPDLVEALDVILRKLGRGLAGIVPGAGGFCFALKAGDIGDDVLAELVDAFLKHRA